MLHRIVISVLVLHLFSPGASAQLRVVLGYGEDDGKVVAQVAEEEEVEAFGKRLRQVYADISQMEEEQIEKVFGQPEDNPGKIIRAPYALSIAQPRNLFISGSRPFRDPKKSKAHNEVYSVQDVVYIKVCYSPVDGKTPILAIVYFPVDKSFPKLTVDNLEERLKWEAERLKKIEQRIADAKPKDG